MRAMPDGRAFAPALRKTFGLAVRRARRRVGLTQEQLALDCGLARNFVSLIELGQTQPTLETIYRLASALDCTGSQLLAELETQMRLKSSKPPLRK